jgi:HEAT repeat protein
MEWMHVPMGTEGLSDLGKKARSAVPKLITIIQQPEDKDFEDSVLIAAAVLRIDPDNRAAVRVLAKDLTDRGWLTNEQEGDIFAVWSGLGSVRQCATAILEAGLVHEKKEKYTDSIRDWSLYRRWEAGIRLRSARLLVAMPQQASKTVAPLIQLCGHEDTEIRAEAAEILSRLPSPSEAVIDRLRELTSDDDYYAVGGDFYGNRSDWVYVGERAAQALADIGVRAVPALRRTLKSGPFHARCWAAGGLGSLGPDAQPATVDLIDCLQDPTPGIRVAAAKALAQIAVDDDRASRALIKALHDRRLDVRIAAADSLGRFGPKAQTAIPALKKMLQDKYQTGRLAAAEALKSIQADSSTPIGR